MLLGRGRCDLLRGPGPIQPACRSSSPSSTWWKPARTWTRLSTMLVVGCRWRTSWQPRPRLNNSAKWHGGSEPRYLCPRWPPCCYACMCACVRVVCTLYVRVGVPARVRPSKVVLRVVISTLSSLNQIEFVVGGVTVVPTIGGVVSQQDSSQSDERVYQERKRAKKEHI